MNHLVQLSNQFGKRPAMLFKRDCILWLLLRSKWKFFLLERNIYLVIACNILGRLQGSLFKSFSLTKRWRSPQNWSWMPSFYFKIWILRIFSLRKYWRRNILAAVMLLPRKWTDFRILVDRKTNFIYLLCIEFKTKLLFVEI